MPIGVAINMSNTVYLFSKISPSHLPFSNVICNVILRPLFSIHLNLLLRLSWFPMTSLSRDCHVTQNHAVIHPIRELGEEFRLLYCPCLICSCVCNLLVSAVVFILTQ